MEQAELLRKVTDHVEKRKADIAANEVMQKLNTIFPPISPKQS